MLLQDKLFKGHQMSIFNQMLYVNVCSAIVSFSGESSPAVHLHSTHRSSLDVCCMLIIVNIMLPLPCKDSNSCLPSSCECQACACATRSSEGECAHKTAGATMAVVCPRCLAALQLKLLPVIQHIRFIVEVCSVDADTANTRPHAAAKPFLLTSLASGSCYG